MVLLLYNLILTLFYFSYSLHCPLSGPDLTYISLLIIPCIIYHVTNKETLNLEWSEKEKISSERQLFGRKCLVAVRGQRRMGRLVRDDRKAILTQITTRCNQGMQNTISEQHVEP